MTNFGTFSDAGESDNVVLVDGTDPTKKNTVSINGDAGVTDGLSNGGVNGLLTLTLANTSYEAKVGASALIYRKSLVIHALDDMYWGYASTVTTANGIPLFKNQQLTFSIDPDSTFKVFLVASGASKTARIAESP
jgi:hypothetical protein